MPVGPTATAAAAWSWVEKMLHEHQRTWAPSSTSVSISTAVWMVMCSDPVIRAPLERAAVAVLGAQGHQAGHLVLGQGDLVASERSQPEIGDLVVAIGVEVGVVMWTLQQKVGGWWFGLSRAGVH